MSAATSSSRPPKLPSTPTKQGKKAASSASDKMSSTSGKSTSTAKKAPSTPQKISPQSRDTSAMEQEGESTKVPPTETQPDDGDLEEVEPDPEDPGDDYDDAQEDQGQDDGESQAGTQVSEGTKSKVGGALSSGKDLSGKAAVKAAKGATNGVNGAKDVSKNVTDNVPVDLSALKGLEVSEAGDIRGKDGNPLGRVVEGDPEDLVGQVVGDDGEILDEDGDAIGRVEVLPEETKEQAEQVTNGAQEQANGAVDNAQNAVPGLDALEGMEVGEDGQIRNSEGTAMGKVVEGNPEDLTGLPLNDQGEILDDDGDAVGRVEALPQEAAEKADDAAGGQVNGLTPDLSILKGRRVTKKGKIIDEEGDIIGTVAEGSDPKALAGKVPDGNGQVLDESGKVIGNVEVVPGEAADEAMKALDTTGESKDAEGDEEKQEGDQDAQDNDTDLPPISTLEGLKCNKQGNIVDSSGKPVGKLVEGDPKKISKSGSSLDSEGQFWDSRGNVIGKAETIQVEDDEEEGAFAGLEGLIVVKDGWVEDENDNRVGQVVDGDAKKLVGRAVDEDGDIIDKRGNVIGHADRYEEPDEEPEPEEEPEKVDLSMLQGLTPNKMGNVIGPDGVPIARVSEGNPKELANRKIDNEGQVWNDSGKVIGRCELIPENEREAKPEGPFAGLDGLVVGKDGLVRDEDDNVVGKVAEGEPRKLVGRAVDEDGDIIDKYGNTKGRVEPYELPEEEVEEEDLSSLAGKVVNKAGNVVDSNGAVFGRISSGDPKKLAGRKVDGKGQIWGDEGKVVGNAELTPGGEENKPEGPFSGFENLTVGKDGIVQTGSGETVGRITEGDPKKLQGRAVDDDGDILDKSGNTIGKAERWEPEEKEREVNPMSGRKVNKEGEVRDEDGNLIGKLTDGNLQTLIGKAIDDNGYVVDNDGNKIGECTLLDNIPEEEPEEPEPELSEEDKKAEQDKELAVKMSSLVQQTIEQVQPICKSISEHIEKADRTPKEELDEEELVKAVKPLIEEGGRILQETNGAIRALDPDGRIAANAKAKAAQQDASPQEYRLADLLKELTNTVVTTIDNAKKRIADMPHAKKELNPLWGLLSEPLFQIIAAVGLLLTGVLGLVGKLLDGLGLGGLIRGLLSGTGLDKLIGGLGLSSVTDALGLTGKK